MKIPTENEFLDGMKRLEDYLQHARNIHYATMFYLVNTKEGMAGCHAKLESAHDALVTLLGMFAEEPQPVVAALDMCQVAESL